MCDCAIRFYIFYAYITNNLILGGAPVQYVIGAVIGVIIGAVVAFLITKSMVTKAINAKRDKEDQESLDNAKAKAKEILDKAKTVSS